MVEKEEDMSEADAGKVIKVMKDAGAVEVTEKEEPEGYIKEEND
jgi:hypothetical protein